MSVQSVNYDELSKDLSTDKLENIVDRVFDKYARIFREHKPKDKPIYKTRFRKISIPA